MCACVCVCPREVAVTRMLIGVKCMGKSLEAIFLKIALFVRYPLSSFLFNFLLFIVLFVFVGHDSDLCLSWCLFNHKVLHLDYLNG